MGCWSYLYCDYYCCGTVYLGYYCGIYYFYSNSDDVLSNHEDYISTSCNEVDAFTIITGITKVFSYNHFIVT